MVSLNVILAYIQVHLGREYYRKRRLKAKLQCFVWKAYVLKKKKNENNYYRKK